MPSEDLLRHEDVIGNEEVRALCGIKTRATLITWRRTRGFPAPFKKIAAGELWDARQVRSWLKAQKEAA